MYSLIVEYPEELVSTVGEDALLKKGMLKIGESYPFRKEDFIFLDAAILSRNNLCDSYDINDSIGFYDDFTCIREHEVYVVVSFFNLETTNSTASHPSRYINPEKQLSNTTKLLGYTDGEYKGSMTVIAAILQVSSFEEITPFPYIELNLCNFIHTLSEMYDDLKKMTRIWLDSDDFSRYVDILPKIIVSYLSDEKGAKDTGQPGDICKYVCGIEETCDFSGEYIVCKSNGPSYGKLENYEAEPVSIGFLYFSYKLEAQKDLYWRYFNAEGESGTTFTFASEQSGHCTHTEERSEGFHLEFKCSKFNGLKALVYAEVIVKIKRSKGRDNKTETCRSYVIYLGEHTIKDGVIEVNNDYLSSFISDIGVKEVTSAGLLSSIDYPTVNKPDSVYIKHGEKRPALEGIETNTEVYDVSITGTPYVIIDLDYNSFSIRWEKDETTQLDEKEKT